MKKFQHPAILEGVTPLKDGGVSLRFHTNEVTKDQKVELMDFYQTFGYLLFSAQEMDESDVPKDAPQYGDGKSPSQRQRASIFVLWKHMGGKGDFEVFYRQTVENHITKVKAKIAELEEAV